VNENPQYIRQTLIVSYRDERGLGGWGGLFNKYFVKSLAKKYPFALNISPFSLYEHRKF